MNTSKEVNRKRRRSAFVTDELKGLLQLDELKVLAFMNILGREVRLENKHYLRLVGEFIKDVLDKEDA